MRPYYGNPLFRSASAIGFALALAFGTANAQTATDSLVDAQKLLKQGQLNPALSKVDQFLASKPKDPQGRFTKGLILAELNKTGDAIAIFTKLTEDYPELPEPYNNLAVLHAQQKQYDQARKALESAIKTHPSYAIAHENLGDVYAKLASQAYNKALQLDSNNKNAQNKLSLIRDLISVSAAKPGAKPDTRSEPVKVAAAEPVKAAPPVAPAAPANTTPPPQPAAPVAQTPAAKPVAPVTPAPAVPAKPETAKPEAAKPTASGNASQEAESALRAWAAAWSKKDVKGYLSAYAPDFQVPGGQSRSAWEQERTVRIDKPGKIEVSIEKPEVTVSGDTATIKFRQHYKSASLKTSATKTLVFVRKGSRWLIQQERVN